MRILVVDDLEPNVYQLQVLLGANGYTVDSAGNGTVALEKARQNPPDLIITDILMPVMDGFALCHEWMLDERLKRIPLIFYTATYTSERDRKFALDLGAARFIVKPEDPEVLLRTIQAVLADREHGGPSAVPTLPSRQTEYLQGHNEALFRKLEDKVKELEETNRQLADDCVEREQAQRALQTSLLEKEALLKEVHHRVKNNLQLMTSLVRLESSRSGEAAVRNVLRDMQGRIQAMALLHETLYQSGTFASVDLGAYLKQLATRAFRALNTRPGAIQLELDLASVQVSMDVAIPCGLLLNELITNGLKHGFADGRAGEIRAELHVAPDGASLRLRVADTGPGLPADFERRCKETLGLQLASDLARQLGGRLESVPGPGAAFVVTFPARRAVAPEGDPATG